MALRPPTEEIKKNPRCWLWEQYTDCTDKPALSRGPCVKTQPSPLGRGCRAPALSPAGARRVRGHLHASVLP
jgi:hypothetical protein